MLRKIAKTVAHPKSGETKRLAKAMLVTMNAAGGVGIAAPQVGKSLRLFIVASWPNARYQKAPRMQPIVMINPRLVRHSKKRLTDVEGCLSIPGIRGAVPRYASVDITFTTLHGEKVAAKLTGFIARIFQHEFDHINGHVFLDRVANTRTLMTEKEYRQHLGRS